MPLEIVAGFRIGDLAQEQALVRVFLGRGARRHHLQDPAQPLGAGADRRALPCPAIGAEISFKRRAQISPFAGAGTSAAISCGSRAGR